jgi:hypothetical protein
VLRRLMAAFIAAGVALGPIGAASVRAAAVAEDDAYGVVGPAILEDQQFSVAAADGVFANDMVGLGESLCLVNEPIATSQGGGIVLFGDGSFTYTPPVNFAGVDTFAYGVAAEPDGGICPDAEGEPATVTLTVTQVNDPPLIEKLTSCLSTVTVAEDSAPSTTSDCVNITSFGPSEPGQSVVAWVVTTGDPALFSVQPSVTLDDPWVLQFTPAPDANGSTQLTIRARDSGGTANGGVNLSAPVTVDVTITPVNDAPSASGDAFAALAGRTLNVGAPGVLRNDSDVDGASLTAVLASAPLHGSLTLAANGGFSYTPQAGFLGSDAFSYRASDGALSSPIRVVSLTITAVPAPTPTPVITAVPSAEATAAPTAEVTAEPSLEATIDPGDSVPAATTPSTAAPVVSPSPGASPEPTPTGDGGGLSLPLLLVLVLLGVLLAFGAAYAIPRWIRSRRGVETLD